MRYRMLALDLDGTVLDPKGDLREGVRDAVAAAARRGLQVVLCTGRRFRTALPLARRLELSGSIIVNNGVLVKDLGSGETLHHSYLRPEIHAEVLALLRETGPPLVYVDTYHERIDMLTERPSEAHIFQREYLDDTTDVCRIVDDLGAVRRRDVILMSMMADEATLEALRSRGERVLGNRVRMHSLINKNYRGQILEFLSPDSGKWSALRTRRRGEHRGLRDRRHRRRRQRRRDASPRRPGYRDGKRRRGGEGRRRPRCTQQCGRRRHRGHRANPRGPPLNASAARRWEARTPDASRATRRPRWSALRPALPRRTALPILQRADVVLH
jgi:hydroxymethylpyrimidine pyrophosphatase-like HAD family hydrolase